MRWDMLDYSHAYFIFPISLWLTFRKRAGFKNYLIEGNSGKNILGFFIFFVGISLFVFGWRQDYLFISTLSMIPLVFGLILYLYGSHMAKALSFPILYLLLLVPPPFGILDSITLPMRHNVSIATEKILSSLGYPIKRAGLELTIGYYKIFMGAPCSGFRSLVTMFSLVIVYVYISKISTVRKLTLASLIVPFALLGNLIRVITLCLITFYFGETVGQGFFHNFSGIVIFIIALLGVIGIELILDKFLKEKINE